MGVAVGMTVLVGETAWVGVDEAGGIGVADGKGVDEAGGIGVAVLPHPARNTSARTEKKRSRLLISLFLPPGQWVGEDIKKGNPLPE
jgi:hypothetical protein